MLLGLLLSPVLAGARDDGYTLRVLSSGGDSVVLELQIGQVELRQLGGSEGWVLPTLSGSVQLQAKGDPALPQVSIPLGVWGAEGVSCRVLSVDEEVLQGVRIAPSQGPMLRSQNPDSLQRKEGPIYRVDTFFPREQLELGAPYQMRDLYGQVLCFRPLRYNGARRELRIVRRVELSLRGVSLAWVAQFPTGADVGLLSVEESSPAVRHAFRSVRGMHSVEKGKMIIVTPAKYLAQLARFVRWKRLRGVPVEVVLFKDAQAGYTTVQDTTELKTLLANRYRSAEGLKYVLLVGGRKEVPPLRRQGCVHMSDSDQAYGQLEGNDAYNEVYVGRFSAQTDRDVAVQIDRTIWYERDATSSATWAGTALGIASHEPAGSADNGESDREHIEVIAKLLEKHGYSKVHRLYAVNSESIKADSVTGIVNRGVGLINYVGHGKRDSWVTSGLTSGQVSLLSNKEAFPYIFDVACNNGIMEGGSCFAEQWVWARSFGEPRGALAIVASSDQQDWAAPMRGQDAMVEYLTGEKSPLLHTFGAVTTYGMARMLDRYAIGGYGVHTVNTWNVFGDPSVLLRTKTPQPLNVEYDRLLTGSQTTYTVRCDAEGIEATLCLTRQGGEPEYYYSAFEGGVATFEGISFSQDTKVELVVWGVNKETFLADDIVVVADTNFLLQIDSLALEPIKALSSSVCQPGDTWGVRFRTCYKGLAPKADSLLVKLSVEPPEAISVLGEDVRRLPVLDRNESYTSDEPFKFQLAKSLKDGDVVKLQLQGMRGKKQVCVREYSIKVVSSALALDRLAVVQDSDNDGTLKAGEHFQLGLWLSNVGGAPMGSALARVSWLDMPSQPVKEVTLAGLETNATKLFTTDLEVPSSVGAGEVLRLQVEVTSTGHAPLVTTLVLVEGGPFVDAPNAISQFPFAAKGKRQVTQVFLTSKELGTTPCRVMALRFPLHFSNNIEPSWESLSVTLEQHYEMRVESLEPPDIDALSSETKEPQQVTWRDGELWVQVTPFEYDGTTPVLMTIAADNLLEDAQYSLLTWPAKQTKSRIFEQTHGGELHQYNVMRAPKVAFVTAQRMPLPLRFVDSQDEPAIGVKITINGKDWFTDSKGEVNLDMLEGFYYVEASSLLYRDTSFTIIARLGNTIPTCRLREASPMPFTICLLYTGDIPVQDASIKVAGYLYRTDASGVARLYLSPGDYRLHIEANGCESQDVTLYLRKRTTAYYYYLTPKASPVDPLQVAVEIAPNPVGDFLRVASPQGLKGVRIWGLRGELIAQRDELSTEYVLPLHGLQAGVYLVEVLLPDGSRCVRKVVKE